MGVSGVIAELAITGHTESPAQWIPLGLGGLGVVAYAVHTLARSSLTMGALWIVMVLLVLAGMVGIALHMNGKMEFKHESDASLKGIALFVASLESKSPPALAPGALVQLGLLGLAWLYSESVKEKLKL